MNFYSKLISKVDPEVNKPMFHSIQIQLACAACIKAEKSHECQHLQHLIPRWQDSDKHRRLKVIMSDRTDLIDSELGGIAIGNNNQCFRAVDIKRMFETTMVMTTTMNMPFFICVDPAAGGENSDFALVSFVVVSGVYRIIGAETLQTKDPQKTFELLGRHIRAIRCQYPEFANGFAKVIIERNLGFEAEHMYREVRCIPRICFMKEPNNDRIGILTTQNVKLAMVTMTNILLRENRIFAEKKSSFIDLNKNKTREVLQDQLSFFSFTFSTPQTVLQKERWVISGKAAGGKDDLCMSALLGIYFSTDTRYIFVS